MIDIFRPKSKSVYQNPAISNTRIYESTMKPNSSNDAQFITEDNAVPNTEIQKSNKQLS